MLIVAMDFWSVISVVCLLAVVSVTTRIVRIMASVTEQTICFIMRVGMAGLARMMLSILIGYDRYTYHKSRFLLWNQVRFRLMLFWGGCLMGLVMLLLLKGTHGIESISTGFIGLLAVYFIIRCLIYWLAPADRINTAGASPSSSIHDVNERATAGQYRSHQLIRPCDYLDELFAEP